MEVVDLNKDENEHKEFDLTVHKRHPKTGKTVSVNPYRLFVVQGTQYFERPKGSGNLYFKSNVEAGRRILKGDKYIIDEKAEHVEMLLEPTQDEKSQLTLAAKDQELASIRAELAAMKREKKQALPDEKLEANKGKKSAKDSIEVISAKGK